MVRQEQLCILSVDDHAVIREHLANDPLPRLAALRRARRPTEDVTTIAVALMWAGRTRVPAAFPHGEIGDLDRTRGGNHEAHLGHESHFS